MDLSSGCLVDLHETSCHAFQRPLHRFAAFGVLLSFAIGCAEVVLERRHRIFLTRVVYVALKWICGSSYRPLELGLADERPPLFFTSVELQRALPLLILASGRFECEIGLAHQISSNFEGRAPCVVRPLSKIRRCRGVKELMRGCESLLSGRAQGAEEGRALREPV